MRTVFALLLIFALTACSNSGRKGGYEFIAHAGGAIDGCVYSNSYEALVKAAESGYRFIEVDFAYTEDSVLVAAHSWEKFNEISGFPHKGDTAPCVTEFLSRRIYSDYTPVTAADVQRFFVENDSLFLVVDKMSDVKVLGDNFPFIKERMLVEAFSYDDYVELLDSNYYRVMYSCMSKDIISSLLKHLVLHRIFAGPKIEWITLHTSVFEKSSFKVIDALSNYKAALFTVNDTVAEIPESYRDRVYMIYTDSIKP
jgi:glycerophosphoryl diester phosphodiesterase